MSSTRKPKWHPTPPPPPSPKILHFPRRTRRKNPRNTKKKQLYPMEKKYDYYKGRLECLFDQERHFHGSSSSLNPILLINTSTSSSSSSSAQRRERVEEQEQEGAVNGGGDAGDREEEKWRFQADMLRAECNFLRMERQFALKKLERNRIQMEKTLRSAVHTLIAGKKKIFEGKNVNAVLEEEIEDLAEKLEELKTSCKSKDVELRHCSNFDKKACHLQKRLEKLGGLTDEKTLKELQQLAQSTNEIDKETKNNTSADVELLREKMEGLSKGMLDRMEEEYGAILSSTANSSASTSKRIDSITDPTSSFSIRQQPSQDMLPLEENKCSGRCKVIVRRIVEQVRAETEQWSQMQEMLQQVRGEMEELQASRDFWENRALNFAHEIQSLQSSVEEWKDKAQAFETKAKDMQYELTAAKAELEKSRTKRSTAHDQREVTSTPNSPLLSLAKQIEKEKRVLVCRLKEENVNQKLQKQRGVEVISTKDLPPVSLGKQLEKEKRMFMHRLKENRGANDTSCKREVSPVGRRKEHSCSKESRVPKRPPFRDVGNSSPLLAAHVSLLKVGSRSYNTAAKNRIRDLFPSNCSNATSPCNPGTSYGPLSRYQILLGLGHKEYCTTTGNEEKQTISVTFVDKDGEEKHIKVPVGMSLLEAAHENDIELEGACEGSLACSTCHVIVMDVDQYNKLEDPTDEENDMLDLAFGLTETSRLGCQVIAKPELDGIRVALPAATRNFAVDGFKPKPH